MFETKGLESLESALARVVDDVAAANNTKHEDASETVSLTVGDSASLSTPEPPRFGCAGHTTTNNNKSTPRFTFCLSAEDEKVLRSVMTIIGDYDSLVEKDTTKSFIPMLEARGGTDKDPVTGHRRDSVPIANAIDQEGSHTAVFSYLEDSECPEAVHSNNLLRQHLLSCATGVVVRVNPGTLSPTSQKNLDMMLTELGSAGIAIMSSPVVQKMMGAKDALFKIRELDCGMVDTYVYYDAPNFSVGFRKSIAQGPRVIKQNR